MARTANRRVKSEEAQVSKENVNSFQTAIYTRISRDKKEKPSDSIENQIALCESYIKRNDGHNLVGIYRTLQKQEQTLRDPTLKILWKK